MDEAARFKQHEVVYLQRKIVFMLCDVFIIHTGPSMLLIYKNLMVSYFNRHHHRLNPPDFNQGGLEIRLIRSATTGPEPA